jgi:hypothetical protein
LEPKSDVANGLFGRRTQGRLPVRVRRGFVLEARRVRLGDWLRVGLVIDARAFSMIDANCADLVADGVDLTGLYAQVAADGSEPWAEDRRPTIRSVGRVDGRRIILGSDRREDLSEVDLDAAWLDPSPAALEVRQPPPVGTWRDGAPGVREARRHPVVAQGAASPSVGGRARPGQRADRDWQVRRARARRGTGDGVQR